MVAAILAVATMLLAEPVELQGNWQGTGLDERYELVFCDDVLAIHVGTNWVLSARESRFTADSQRGTIDIVRDDGIQLGRFQIDGDQLILMLADVDAPRPSSIEFSFVKPSPTPIKIDKKARKPPSQRRFVFRRVP